MPLPLLALALLGAGSAAGGVANSIAGRRTQRDQNEQNNLDRELAQERLDFEKSQANPFLPQLQQARSINMLEGMGRSSYTRPTVTPTGAYGGSMPQIDGGFSFESGPDGPAAARALEGTVMQGLTRPTDRTGGLDVLGLLAGDNSDLWAGGPPTAVPRPTTRRRSGPMGFVTNG